ncbi:hypothetical protein HPULCUR_003863 [Helicostylum pulchrum]|uniref:Uncharacterized protein n=1 Tax=Helicostylum pulchrum TaxID=562976 RepID=A0ABP9XUK8_9FUNG
MNIQVTDRQSRYCNALGRNNILDESDESGASQIARYSGNFPAPIIAISNDIALQFESLQDNMNHLVSDTKYLKKFLEKVRQAKIHDNCSIIQDTYTHIINLKLYHQYLFQEIEEPFLSEADYQVKASGSLFETIFRGSDIILHWGETISYNCQVLGQRPKMDQDIIKTRICIGFEQKSDGNEAVSTRILLVQLQVVKLRNRCFARKAVCLSLLRFCDGFGSNDLFSTSCQ